MKRALSIVAGVIVAGVMLTACGGADDAPATYADLTAAQQAHVDAACHTDGTFPADHPTEFAHCVATMTRQAAGE